MRRLILAAASVSALVSFIGTPAYAVGVRYPFCIQGDRYPGLSTAHTNPISSAGRPLMGSGRTASPIPSMPVTATPAPISTSRRANAARAISSSCSSIDVGPAIAARERDLTPGWAGRTASGEFDRPRLRTPDRQEIFDAQFDSGVVRRRRPRKRAGQRAKIRFGLSGLQNQLPVGWRRYRLWLHIDGAVPGNGLRSSSDVLQQSLLRRAARRSSAGAP